MNDWIKSNVIALVVLIGGGIAAYAVFVADNSKLYYRVEQLEHVAAHQGDSEKRITLLEARVNGLTAQLDELKPLLKGLTHNIVDLNLTLVESKKDNSYLKNTLSELKASQRATQKNVQEIKVRMHRNADRTPRP